jgi:hypothetical protein
MSKSPFGVAMLHGCLLPQQCEWASFLSPFLVFLFAHPLFSVLTVSGLSALDEIACASVFVDHMCAWSFETLVKLVAGIQHTSVKLMHLWHYTGQTQVPNKTMPIALSSPARRRSRPPLL